MKLLLKKIRLPASNFWQLNTICACTFVVILSGCGQAKSPSVQAAVVETNQSPTIVSHEPVLAAHPAAAAPLITPSGEPDLAELNRTLLRWVMGNRRKPASFEEFAASANATIPPAPPGQKYAIDKSMHIVLIKQ